MTWGAAVLAVWLASGAAAQVAFPVKIYPNIQAFRGGAETVITRQGQDVFLLVSGHKEARRPWVDVIVRRRGSAGESYLARAFDCRAGTVRRLGEAARIIDIPLSVPSIDYLRDRPVAAGSLDHAIGRFACGL